MLPVVTEPRHVAGRYQWFGWTVPATAGGDVTTRRLVETHEYFHRQLDDTTAFGGLTTTIAALAEADPDGRWPSLRDRLQAMSDLVHETFAVGTSLLTTQRALAPVDGYPLYDRYVDVARRVVGDDVHPWVALAALRAAATACMQSDALRVALAVDLTELEAGHVDRLARPNHRLVALLAGGFTDVVDGEQQRAAANHGTEAWWLGSERVSLTPESMDGHARDLSQALHLRLLDAASSILKSAGAVVTVDDGHHEDLRELLERARALAPDGLARIGALVEQPGGELLHGGALDSQTIPLTAAPLRATVLPYGSVSGFSGQGDARHGFVSVVRPQRIALSYELQGVPLPDAPAVAALRTTVFEGEERDSVLFVLASDHEQVARDADGVPVYVSVTSSAAAAAPELTATWMRAADRRRLSLVMDTPATAALRRWCAGEDARFRTSTRRVAVEDMDVWIIAGRVEQGEGRSALVVIPTTEFGARWFEAATAEDPLLGRAVQVDENLFEEETPHLDVVLNHLLLEEHVTGTGSWLR
jgi:hypothetical protein